MVFNALYYVGVENLRLLTVKQVAELLQVNKGTLALWRENRKANKGNAGPPYIKLERAVRYRVSDVEAFLQSRQG